MSIKKPAAKNFKLFDNGKLNTNWPRGYNIFLGFVDMDYNNKKRDLLPDIREL